MTGLLLLSTLLACPKSTAQIEPLVQPSPNISIPRDEEVNPNLIVHKKGERDYLSGKIYSATVSCGDNGQRVKITYYTNEDDSLYLWMVNVGEPVYTRGPPRYIFSGNFVDGEPQLMEATINQHNSSRLYPLPDHSDLGLMGREVQTTANQIFKAFEFPRIIGGTLGRDISGFTCLESNEMQR